MSRTLGELLARLVVGELPEIATVERVISERGGKVYVDYLQNRRGQLLVAPFSVRPISGAPVSTPLRWREVRKGLDIGRYTIRTVPRRLSRMAEDLILWSGAEFAFVSFDESFATGSSLMPQKQNPDGLELIRGKTGRLAGNLVSLLTTTKGLATGYQRHLQ